MHQGNKNTVVELKINQNIFVIDQECGNTKDITIYHFDDGSVDKNKSILIP